MNRNIIITVLILQVLVFIIIGIIIFIHQNTIPKPIPHPHPFINTCSSDIPTKWTWSFNGQNPLNLLLTPMAQNDHARPACFFTITDSTGTLPTNNGNTTYAIFQKENNDYKVYIDNTIDNESKPAKDVPKYWQYTAYYISGNITDGFNLKSQDGVTNSIFTPNK